MRDKTQADFDLDRIIDCLDEAIMSTDPRIQECLRRLMVTVALIQPEGHSDRRRTGPLRQIFADMGDINRRLTSIESQMHRIGPVDMWSQAQYDPLRTAVTTAMPPTVTYTAGDTAPWLPSDSTASIMIKKTP